VADLQGTCDERFAVLSDILAAQIDSGDELGASVAVTVDGEMVVDMWGGWVDPEMTEPWARDTITNVWSITKTMTSLCALVLVERGELDVFAPVATYWPEFAVNGKERIEVRHLMSHTSGVSAWDQPVEIEDLYDWNAAVSRLAGQEPWWEPGTASGYHLWNQGHLVGEVVRRISGKPLGRFFADEVAGPLGADFHIGLDPSQFHRVSNVVPPPPRPDGEETMPEPGSVAHRTMNGPALTPEVAWTASWRQADIGAGNGHGNARSVARIQSVVANDGRVDDVALLSPETIELIFREQSNGVDLVAGTSIRFGIGYGLPNESVPFIGGGRADARACYWTGWGGSLVVIDVDRRMTFAFMMNAMEDGVFGKPTSRALCAATYDVLHPGDHNV
jgi:CubicO group peptidase (beta-lactamase class C family)